MNPFDVLPTPIQDLRLLKRCPVSDDRGFLERLFCSDTLAFATKGRPLEQINRTLTKKIGALRGMHFQVPPHAEMKIVSCIKGRVWDVAVDLRKGSPTFLKAHAVELTEENCLTYIIPEGFAHGFQTLTANCEMLYFHTAPYNAGSDRGLNATDPLLNIKWPLSISERSSRDCNHPMLTGAFEGIEIL